MQLLFADYAIEHDYSFTFCKYHFGFADAEHTFGDQVTLMQLGPLGEFHHVPFSAAQGWLIVSVVLVAAVAVMAGLGVKLRRRKAL